MREIASGMSGTSWLSVFFAPRGRVNRLQYWVVSLVTVVVSNLDAYVLDAVDRKAISDPWPLLLACLAVALVSLYSALAVTLKRLHDRDKSGSWYLLGLIPILGWIWLFVEVGIRPGLPGPNRFGPDPSRDEDGSPEP